MTYSRRMLQVSRGARLCLGDEADHVAHFARSHLQEDGGFRGRGRQSDLYYTVFAMDCISAMGHALPCSDIAGFLRSFGDGANLDFIHLTCLARCWSRLSDVGAPPDCLTSILGHIETYRTADGGYSHVQGKKHGSVYGAFLALQAYEDLDAQVPEPERVAGSIESLRSGDGAFSNEPGAATGMSAATAGAMILLRHFGMTAEHALSEWLLEQISDGGFLAMPAAPLPDLLSTAVSLFAMRTIDSAEELPGVGPRGRGPSREHPNAVGPLEGGTATSPSAAGLSAESTIGIIPREIVASCLDYVLGLLTEAGGFCGSWMDDTPDCEYTFYGLLALGCLSGEPNEHVAPLPAK